MNLPNKLTILRVILIPFVMFFYLANFIEGGKIIALILFIVAAITDFMDGAIARRNNMVTDFGKFLDPIADKLLVVSVLCMIVVDGTIPHPWGVICLTLIIGRELIIDAFRLIASTKGIVLAADILGKAKTMVQCWAMPFCILLSYLMFDLSISGAGLTVMQVIAYILIGLSTVLTVLSGINYFIKNKGVIK
ncbi:MAG: CDP-diacylglycerol--glycerol-3-phosphate 3-phosphatidyltransferase, partial [Clostridia bacterium]|nr:CDP-diacylglycerol--glycerol-3-phosphate 3-phosphatidyltransferase [Clostridia bacterium]